MILKNKVKNDSSSGSNFLSLNRDRDRLQKYWANDDIKEYRSRVLAVSYMVAQFFQPAK